MKLSTLNSQLSTLICALALLTGCATWDGLSPGAQTALKAAAKIALSYGVQELGDRVKEVRPFQGSLQGLIETTFAKPLTAEETGAALKKGVAASVPAEHQAAVLAQFKTSLARGASAASPGVRPKSQDFNNRVASNL